MSDNEEFDFLTVFVGTLIIVVVCLFLVLIMLIPVIIAELFNSDIWLFLLVFSIPATIATGYCILKWGERFSK